MFEVVAFYFFGITSVALFCISVASKNILYAMSSLAGGMIFVSGLFFLLEAEFLGVVQIIVYVGAVMVLYAFSMMFFDASKNVAEIKKGQKLIFSMSVISALLTLFILLAPSFTMPHNPPNQSELGNIANVGFFIFTKYLLLFELVAIMLLVAMVCGIVLVHKDMDSSFSENLKPFGDDIKDET